MDFSILNSIPAWLAIFIVLLGVIYLYVTSGFGYLEKQGVKTANAWPFIGSLSLRNPKHATKFDGDLYNKYGRMYGYYEGRNPVLHIGDPDLIKQITVKDFSSFPYTRKVDMFGTDNKIFKHMLTNLDGEKWKTLRSIMSPTFTTGKLKQMTYLIEECCGVLVKNLNKFAEAGEPFQAKACMSSYTLDVIAACAFGTKIDTMTDPDNLFQVHTKKLFSLDFNPRMLIAFFAPKLMQYLPIEPVFPTAPFSFFEGVVNRVIAMRKNEKESPRDFLALMLEAEVEENGEQQEVEGSSETNQSSISNKKVIDKDVIVSQMILFLLAGHETTATTLAFALHSLAKNPDVQDKLAAEVQQVLQDNEGKISYQAIAEMPYLDMVVTETLRMYPPAVRMERTCVDDGYELGGITLKKGMVVGIPVYCMHHDPENYPNPDKFEPERFTPEEKAKRNPFLYLPFGAGPRNCIAMRFALMEAKITLAYIIKEFVFKTCPQTEETFDYFTFSPMLQPKTVTIAIEKRKKV